ncbi:MAG: hypothetical protein ABW148_17255 [Sedimenticola sp.]
METLGIAISIGLVALIVAIPIYAVSKGLSFVRSNLFSIPIILCLVTVGAYWPHFYKDLRLEMMGVNREGMTDVQRTRNVSPGLQGEAIELYWSLMGVGWPFKAIIGMVLIAPYPSVVWLAGFGVRRFRRSNRSEIT